ncbi:MAG: HAD family hydrolase [Bryobacteraceae bacterium]
MRALIFDMDGVIIDSNPVHREAWVAFNRTCGLETTDAMHDFMYGKRNDEIVRNFFGEELTGEEVAARGAAKEALYRELIAPRLKERLVPGVEAFLEKHSHLPMAVATNAEPANVDFLLDRAELRRFFRVVVDGHQVSRPKPDPEVYLRAAAALGVDPADTVVFEDSFPGVASAKGAGARVVALRTTHSDLGTAVDLIVDNFLSPELEPWLAMHHPPQKSQRCLL